MRAVSTLYTAPDDRPPQSANRALERLHQMRTAEQDGGASDDERERSIRLLAGIALRRLSRAHMPSLCAVRPM
jgi:hypothetical protein